MKFITAIFITTFISGCASVPVGIKLTTPYGTVTRTAAGKTVIEADISGFLK